MHRSGLELAAGYHRDVIGPILASAWPDMPYAAARLGSGSDVLGLDDATSADHDWGLRLTLLVPETMVDEVRDGLEGVIPAEYAGFPTHIPLTWLPEPALAVEVESADAFAESRLGVDVHHEWSVDEWLSITGQAVLEVTAGKVFVDTAGRITEIRRRLAWYPDDVWRWVIAAAWFTIAEEFPFVGRAGDRGDDLGSRLIAARISWAIMHLGFLLERRWPPYAKWFGSTFATLPAVGGVAAVLADAMAAASWPERQSALAAAVESMADRQRALGLPIDDVVTEPFFDRPFIAVRPVHEALLGTITDPALAARVPLIGAVEQWCHSVPALVSPAWRNRR